MHWREVANSISCEDPDILRSKDEEYSLYNFLLDCREQFVKAFAARDQKHVLAITQFVSMCLENNLDSDGEELEIAAGAAFAEHLFDDITENEWPELYKAVGRDFYCKCRRRLKNWIDEDVFERIERIHTNALS